MSVEFDPLLFYSSLMQIHYGHRAIRGLTLPKLSENINVITICNTLHYNISHLFQSQERSIESSWSLPRKSREMALHKVISPLTELRGKRRSWAAQNFSYLEKKKKKVFLIANLGNEKENLVAQPGQLVHTQ